MDVNGFHLPDAFESMCRAGAFVRARGSWQLKQDVDAYGNPLETQIGQVFTDETDIAMETAKLPEHFQADGCYGTPDPERLSLPGGIPDITDFAMIICAAIAGGGEPFCLDYRASRNSPSVILWDDIYWRRIAPDFRSFIGLFDMVSDT